MLALRSSIGILLGLSLLGCRPHAAVESSSYTLNESLIAQEREKEASYLKLAKELSALSGYQVYVGALSTERALIMDAADKLRTSLGHESVRGKSFKYIQLGTRGDFSTVRTETVYVNATKSKRGIINFLARGADRLLDEVRAKEVRYKKVAATLTAISGFTVYSGIWDTSIELLEAHLPKLEKLFQDQGVRAKRLDRIQLTTAGNHGALGSDSLVMNIMAPIGHLNNFLINWAEPLIAREKALQERRDRIGQALSQLSGYQVYVAGSASIQRVEQTYQRLRSALGDRRVQGKGFKRIQIRTDGHHGVVGSGTVVINAGYSAESIAAFLMAND